MVHKQITCNLIHKTHHDPNLVGVQHSPPYSILMWLVSLIQLWTHYKIGKLDMWTLFCNVCIEFLNNQIWKEIMLELNGRHSSVTMSWTDFSFQNLVFWNLFKFSAIKITLKIIYLPHSKSKSYQINSIKPCSSRYFQQH
jgi:hypothetical protein